MGRADSPIDPSDMVESFNTKFGTYFEITDHTDNSRHRWVEVTRTDEGIDNDYGKEPLHEVYQFMTANDYCPIEGQDYVIFAHPEDTIRRRNRRNETYDAHRFLQST